jgi:hypothetical protein
MCLLALAAVLAGGVFAQQPEPRAQTPPQSQSNDRLDEVLKRVDDLMWHEKLGDIADVDKVEDTSLPPQHVTNPKAPGATNPLIIHAYTPHSQETRSFETSFAAVDRTDPWRRPRDFRHRMCSRWNT